VNQPLTRSDRDDVVEIRIPCKAEWVALARLSVAAVASRLQFSIEEIEDIKLAVAEACTHVIQNAKGSSAIEIRCEATSDGLRINVRDFGYNALAEPIRASDVEEERVGGLGVFLIRSLMDDVTYDVHPERGTDLAMFKRLPE
jgi:serine/threonine-protein kinase RsbW